MRILRVLIECLTPLHCGAGLDDIQDQPVNRDAFGYWRIPGSAIAGSLRALAMRLDEKMARKLFGYAEGDQGQASLVWCEDALLLDSDMRPVLEKLLAGQPVLLEPAFTRSYIRDHVRIDLATGAADAKSGGKFDAEIVPAGSRFLLELRCDGWQYTLEQGDADFFDGLCALLVAGKLELGGKGALGYGQYRALEHHYTMLDLGSPEDMQAWLNFGPFSRSVPGNPLPLPSLPALRAGDGLSGCLEIPLACPGPMLIGGGHFSSNGATKEPADMLFCLTPRLNYDQNSAAQPDWLPMLPASSSRGVFRHAIWHILKSQKLADGPALLNALFGSVENDQGQCGKLAFSDSLLESGSTAANFQFVQHVAIDRFSAAAIDGALFSEEPYWTENTRLVLRIQVSKLDCREAAVFFHALLDLFAGSLAFGSGVNRGNGRLCLPDWPASPQQALARLGGDLAWNGQPLLQGAATFSNLNSLFSRLDAAPNQKASA